ncbi:MAG TPA: universal stress protein [Vicinamibacterales bacterium]|jgi:nucleotide-binding universal stress UspA family protein|nr:universal stress protein [Vicinamibacterales bacterium]
MISLKRILVATDFSEASREALQRGQLLAKVFDAQLHLLHVIAEPLNQAWVGYTPASELGSLLDQFEDKARARLEELASRDDLASRRVVIATGLGNAADEILKYAAQQKVDLIICGTHGRRGWNRLAMGSVAERIVRLAHCPVLTVHAGTDESAVA